MDENNPIGAVCLEHGVVPEGHKGPLHDRWARRFSRRTFVNRVRWWTRPTGPAGQLSATLDECDRLSISGSPTHPAMWRGRRHRDRAGERVV